MLSESLQTLGGSGFLQDYPIEQYVRDARIDALYEGTTAIQSLDFFFRKIIKDQGSALAHVSQQISATIGTADARLAAQIERLAAAMADVQAMAAALTGYLMAAQDNPEQLYKVGLSSVRFLMAVGDLLIGWRLLVSADKALQALEKGPAERDRPYYTGKVAVATFFAENMLPLLASVRSVIESVNTDIMELEPEAF
jgi:hypothetical protein